MIVTLCIYLVARLRGFEPLTYGFVVRHSIQLSYRRALKRVLWRNALKVKGYFKTNCFFCEINFVQVWL